MKLRSLAFVMPLLVGVVLLTGCPPKKKLEVENKKTEEEKKPEVVEDTTTAKEPIENAIQISQDWSEIPSLQLVHFNYDSASLEETARGALKGNVAILKKLPNSVTIRVEGHCDARGTVEYNIALGQRRANTVKSYYVTAGIPKSRIETISFGLERPLCSEENENCWAKNRRSATKVRNSETIQINPDTLK